MKVAKPEEHVAEQDMPHLLMLESYVIRDERLCNLDEHLDIKVAFEKDGPLNAADIDE